MAHDFHSLSDPSREVLTLASESGCQPETMADGAALRDYAEHQSAKAFAILAERYTGLIYGTARRRTGSHELSQEIAQNVFAILARKAPALARNATPLAGWLHRATVLESCQALRREGSRRRVLQAFAAEQEQAAAGAFFMNMDEIAPELDEALDQLPRADRELLLARYFDGQSYHELAAATGRNEAALMQQQHRALRKLSRLLQHYGHPRTVTAAALAAGLATPFTAPAPAGLAAACTAHATSAAATAALGFPTLFQLTLAMQTKTSFAVMIAILCLVAGVGGFLTSSRMSVASDGKPLPQAPSGQGENDTASSASDSGKPALDLAGLAIPTAEEVLTATGHERIEKLALWLTSASPAGMGEMLESLGSMKERPTDRLQKELIIQRWMEMDREGAFAACRKADGYAWLACTAWGRLTPREAWAATGKMDPFERNNVLRGIIETDPRLAEKFMKELKDAGPQMYSELHSFIASQLAAKNPREAWEYTLRNGGYSEAAVKEWVKEDPDGAIAFVLGQPTLRQQMKALPSLLGELQQQHPEKIGPLLESLPEGRMKWKATAQQAGWLAANDPEAALTFVRKSESPVTRAVMLQEIALVQASAKPEAALAVLRELDWKDSGNEYLQPDAITARTPPNHFGESKAAEALFKLTEGGHLDEALAVAAAVPPGPRRDQALGAVASGWPAERVYDLSEWTTSQNEPSVKTAGARRIVDYLMADREPDFEAAARWAASLPAPGQPQDAPLVEVMRKWKARDEAAADSALENLDIPEAVRAAILKPDPSQK